ncbi:MAG: sigma-54 dependent transcriptional regulator [Proteobacteria bacterium]|nr:sigma-54 dependent transcriptional regulator [Pseudomonadota bacterium]MBU1738714.1 sigma-54 dependent transcriptional regulator [Pseudomonadota bacterium]
MKNAPPANILIVDDDDSHRYMLAAMLKEWGWVTSEADDGSIAVELVIERPFDAILMDVRMAGMDGMEALEKIHHHNPAIPVVIMTAYSSVDAAVEAIKIGAHDYLTKPLDFDRLRLTLDKALEHKQVFENRMHPAESRKLSAANTGIIGESAEMDELIDMIAQVAPTEATVLIGGESGTGKELVAAALHKFSHRKNGPFVRVNCAALVENLLESELFGHEKGAFTGADKRREGKFFQADGGTIFLDEIGETSPAMQAKLLRVLQENEIQRVGSDSIIKVNVRVIAASNKVLEEEVSRNTFREDLYYRLNVVNLQVPPLRERRDDIAPLTRYFAEKFARNNNRTLAGITPGCMDMMLHYPWPGNVRELENAVERGIILMRGDYLDEESLPMTIRNWINRNRIETPAGSEQVPETLEGAERMVIAQTLAAVGWNKSEAARRLNITRKTLQSKLSKYAIKQD